jgi:hypothetical protein
MTTRPEKVTLPVALQIVADDYGWHNGRDGRLSGQPSRSALPRNHAVEDYIILNEIGKALDMKILAPLVIGEWDKNNRMTGKAHMTKFPDKWDCRSTINMPEAERCFEEIESSDYIEIALHGLLHSFWDEEMGLFADCPDKSRYSVLGNSLAILCGAAEDPKGVCDRMLHLEGVTDISLSMRCFKYDAMLLADKGKYKESILSEIDENYRPMLELGNGTVWETDEGESDFGKAGSLCHGWSAMPIYYYNILPRDF